MRLSPRLEYLLALTPMLTDWIDTGHLPADPREYVTEVVVGILIAVGVHRLHREAARQREHAETDALTGLANRRRFRADLDREVARAQRLGTRLVLAIVDVNAFKAVNDTYGHPAGDRVLRHVAGLLTRGTRDGVDQPYRIGGDEFAVLFAGADAEACLDALRRATPTSRVEPDLPPVTVSVGVVELAPGEDAAALEARADALMYHAKGEPPAAATRCLRLQAV